MRIILLHCLLLAILAQAQAQPRKFALLVGIDDYAASGMRPLQVCNGIPLMRQTLVAQGFADADILELTNEAATARAIREALRGHLGQIRPGDIALFHFTGHGRQIPDDNGDEPDGLDEALVAYDDAMLRDDEIGELLSELCKKAGDEGQVIALIDACHSGSATRGKAARARQRRQYAAGEAPLIAFFASQPHERSYQVNGEDKKPYGPLTYAFCQAMQQANSGTTYRGLFDRITRIMAGRSFRQTPGAEGDLDRLVFGGRVEAPPVYFKPLVVFDEARARLQGGLLNGLHPGTELALYPVDTRDTAGLPPLATGVVGSQKTGLLECELILDQPLQREAFEQAWIFVRKRSFGGYDLHVALEINDDEIREALREMIERMPSATLTEGHPDLLIRQTWRQRIELLLPDGAILLSENFSRQKTDEIRNAIGDYAQAQFLRGLEMESDRFQADMRIESETNEPDIRMRKEQALLTVTNLGADRIFYTIIDIDPRNKTTILLPSEGWNPGDLTLAPGESRAHRVSFDAPGKETLKLIVTSAPIDLRAALRERERGARANRFIEGEEILVKTLIFEVVK